MKKFDIYQIITIILAIAVVVSIGFFLFNLTQGKFGKAALSVDVEYGEAAVTVNNKDKGQTPLYTEEISAGNIEVGISGETNSYTTIITPAAGTLAVIKRDLGVNDSFSSGQNIWFDKSSGEDTIISVISPDVTDVSVIVDDVEMGKTPIRFSTQELLSQDENGKYKISFKKAGYEEQEVEVKVREGYELNIRIDPFLNPITDEIKDMDGAPDGVTFIGFMGTNAAYADKQAWAKAINYWLNTRGAAALGNFNVEKFDYFLDDTGVLYNEAGNQVPAEEVSTTEGQFMAYLNTTQDETISGAAADTLSSIGGSGVIAEAGGESVTVVKILPTGIGFLKVRGGPGTANAEVSRIDVGKEFALLDEESGWYKIEYEAGEEGWVSSTYAEKVEPVAESEENGADAEENTEE